MAAALHARAVEGTRLEELPGIDAARVEGVVDGHLEELDDGVEPARGVGRVGALNVGVPAFGGSDHDARVGTERGRAPQVRLTSGGTSQRSRCHVETVPRRERHHSSRAEGSAEAVVDTHGGGASALALQRYI